MQRTRTRSVERSNLRHGGKVKLQKDIKWKLSSSSRDEPEKRHIFAARSEDNVVQWVIKLRECSYEYLRSRLHTLQSKIFSITGKDPLLMVPRNDGACLWAPAVPFSTVPACTVNTSSFSCHLHTNGAFTLERSKSDVQAHKLLKSEYTKKTTFYTDNQTQIERKEVVQGFALEKSKTSALFTSSMNPIDTSIFDNRPAYSRAAPSPPVRTKLSPGSRRAEPTKETKVGRENENILGIPGLFEEAPIPPRRKASPKPPENHSTRFDSTVTTSREKLQSDSTEDLIQF